MENLIKLRVFRDETTEIFNNIINNVRKFKDKSFIDQIDPFDDKYSEIISDVEIDSLKIFENRFELGKYIRFNRDITREMNFVVFLIKVQKFL